MGLLKGSFTFSRYRLTGEYPPNLRDFIDEKIKFFAFREITQESEEQSIGWTSINNILDTQFEYANYSLADYFIFSLRVDRKIVPSPLLRIKVLEAEEQYMAAKNKTYVGKEQRKDIREIVRSDLLRRTPATPSFYEVCWSVSEKWLLFGSLSRKIKEDFEEFFKRSFNLIPVPFTPWDTQFLDAKTAAHLSALTD